MVHRPLGSAVERVMRIPGVVIPAIIDNHHHFFVDLPVYADGLVDAWELLDLPLFEEKVRSRWVTTRVPNGDSINVHGLGAWTVDEGKWLLNPDQLLQRVRDEIRTLNPQLRNLYDCDGTTSRKVGNVSVSTLGVPKAHPVRPTDDLGFRLTRGAKLSVLARLDTTTYLASLRVFADDSFELGRVPQPCVLSRQELERSVADGSIRTEPKAGERIHIEGLGSFVAVETSWVTDIHQLLLETRDLIDELHHRPDSIARCRRCFEEYTADPSEHTKQALREAYEAVPEHNRSYVGDMDTKDIPIRIVLYGAEEIETWSHRVVARAQGVEPLPSITVPQVDED